MLNRMLVNCNEDSPQTCVFHSIKDIPKPGSKDLCIVSRIADRTNVLFMMFLRSHLCWLSLVLMLACLIPWFRNFEVWNLQLHGTDHGCKVSYKLSHYRDPNSFAQDLWLRNPSMQYEFDLVVRQREANSELAVCPNSLDGFASTTLITPVWCLICT